MADALSLVNFSLPSAAAVPLAGRSLRFENGMFADITFTRSAQQCRDDAQRSREQAATSAHPLLCIARAAWWEAAADQVSAAAVAGGKKS